MADELAEAGGLEEGAEVDLDPSVVELLAKPRKTAAELNTLAKKANATELKKRSDIEVATVFDRCEQAAEHGKTSCEMNVPNDLFADVEAALLGAGFTVTFLKDYEGGGGSRDILVTWG